MSLSESVHSIEQHLVTFAESARQELEQHLPEIAKAAQDAEANPLVLAAAAAAHLPQVPELLGALAAFVNAVDLALGTAKAQAVADARAAAAQPPA